MKVICCLVILSSFGNYVFCQLMAPVGNNDGSMPDETPKEDYCKKENKTCYDECVPCPKVNECTDDQIDCSVTENLWKPDKCGGACPLQPECVPLDYNCPVPPCPATKKMHCGEDEILCSTESPGNDGCPGPDVCVPRGVDADGNLCPGFCPVECKDDQLKCETPIDPITKCAKPAACVSKSKDEKGNFCPNQQCPLHCEETEIKCTGSPTTLGCKEKDTCAPRGKSVSGDLCPGKCPVTCDPTKEVKCNGQQDPTGCFSPDTCHAKARDVNSEFCPDNSDSHGCPTTCPAGEVLCPAKTNILGCKEQAVCRTNTVDNNGISCDEASVCPNICQPNEFSCPGGVDKNGCNKPDICVPSKRDYDGDLCPVHCPEICGDENFLCEGHTDATGCKTADTCAVQGNKTNEDSNDFGGPCPGVCPPKPCKHNEVLCTSQLDCDGCKTEEICRPKAKNNNGDFCADDSASHGCPVRCNDKKGEVVCPTYETALGCKPKAMCIPRPLGSDGKFVSREEACKTSNPCENKGCGDMCISQGDMAGSCDKYGKCSFDYDNLGCKEPSTQILIVQQPTTTPATTGADEDAEDEADKAEAGESTWRSCDNVCADSTNADVTQTGFNEGDANPASCEEQCIKISDCSAFEWYDGGFDPDGKGRCQLARDVNFVRAVKCYDGPRWKDAKCYLKPSELLE